MRGTAIAWASPHRSAARSSRTTRANNSERPRYHSVRMRIVVAFVCVAAAASAAACALLAPTDKDLSGGITACNRNSCDPLTGDLYDFDFEDGNTVSEKTYTDLLTDAAIHCHGSLRTQDMNNSHFDIRLGSV